MKESISIKRYEVNMDWFQRIGLPIILILIIIASVLLVMNAFEATDLMQKEGRAAPTLLNPRPE